MPERGKHVPIGKARIVRAGTDVTLVSYSGAMPQCVAAVQTLSQQGVSVELIDLRTVSPWDQAAVLQSAEKTGRVVVAHEALRSFGPGAEIATTVSDYTNWA